MKLLLVLSLVQTSILAVIAVKLYVTESGQPQSAIQHVITSSALPVESTHTSLSADLIAVQQLEDILRVVIREELDALQHNQQIDRQVASSTPRNHSNFSSEQASQDYLQSLQSDLDYFIADGRISEQDMAKFQMKLARLDETNRKEMLRKLVRAISGGQLEGRL